MELWEIFLTYKNKNKFSIFRRYFYFLYLASIKGSDTNKLAIEFFFTFQSWNFEKAVA